jgi:hypothetical protein
VNSVDQIPVLIFHVFEGDVTQDTSVVDENIDSPKVLDSGFNNGLAILDAVVVGDGLAAGLANLVDDDIGSLPTSVSCFCGVGGSDSPYSTGLHPCESHRDR